MSNIIKITAVMLALALAGHDAQAAEATIITLACDGTDAATLYPTAPSEPVKKMGLVVNFAEHTVSVSGFMVVAHISHGDDATVAFNGESTDLLGQSSSTTGVIDRVTGVTRVHTSRISKDKKVLSADDWDLVCKVTNRAF
jgi:hypothetical protein